ncbi:MAG TPA: Uma2 family endonuclease [Candidatus Aquilonibacter sp.]|nr:Uma2 family endonuclease [Candidatus Aquilonibacter sp.]
MRSIDAKPYIELLDGRPVEKVSPKRTHALLQFGIAAMLQARAGDRGDVATEWRFWLNPGEPKKTTLVPDVAFVSIERINALAPKDREEPPFAPDVAFEVRSPSDRVTNVEWKMQAYLANGSAVVFDVIPDERIVRAFTRDGVTTLRIGDRFSSDRLPWLTFDVADVFANLPQ